MQKSWIADSEVAQEFAQVEVERFQRELSEQNVLIEKLNTTLTVCVFSLKFLHRLKFRFYFVQSKENIITAMNLQSVQDLQRQKEDILQQQEQAKFEMFKSLMDSFLEERAQADRDKKQLQALLTQASKVISRTIIVATIQIDLAFVLFPISLSLTDHRISPGHRLLDE